MTINSSSGLVISRDARGNPRQTIKTFQKPYDFGSRTDGCLSRVRGKGGPSSIRVSWHGSNERDDRLGHVSAVRIRAAFTTETICGVGHRQWSGATSGIIAGAR
jgi:hypothetical protein